MTNDDKKFEGFLNSISPSFCPAKWYESSINLGKGTTSSCSLISHHKIRLEDIKQTPQHLHNTGYKKTDRFRMQIGHTPFTCKGCESRIEKSKIYSEEDIEELEDLVYVTNILPKQLELSFDGDEYKNYNPFVETFFKWWDTELHDSLDNLKIVGEEPLKKSYLWRLVDGIIKTKSQTKLLIESNLKVNDGLIEKLIIASYNIEDINLIINYDLIDKEQKISIYKLLEHGDINLFNFKHCLNEKTEDFIVFITELMNVYDNTKFIFNINNINFKTLEEIKLYSNN